MRALGVACFPSPERAIRALARVAAIASREVDGEVKTQQIAPIEHGGKGLVSEEESKRILARFGISIPRGSLVTNAEDAIRVAEAIGFPVVLKAQSADLPHRAMRAA